MKRFRNIVIEGEIKARVRGTMMHGAPGMGKSSLVKRLDLPPTKAFFDEIMSMIERDPGVKADPSTTPVALSELRTKLENTFKGHYPNG